MTDKEKIAEAVKDALDDINESVWADDEGNKASATAFLARAIRKLEDIVHPPAPVESKPKEKSK